MNSLMQALGARAVGAVESVTANEISVLVGPDAPQAVAFNAGAPVSFPRINGYLIIPNEVGATVGWIASVRVVRAPFPKRTGMRDFGLIDLPFPSRMVTLMPLGTLVRRSGIEAELPFEVRRGVDVFPSVLAMQPRCQGQCGLDIAGREHAREIAPIELWFATL